MGDHGIYRSRNPDIGESASRPAETRKRAKPSDKKIVTGFFV